jgi:hypothetical protein
MGGILLFLSFDYYFHYYYYSFASFERVLHSLYILCLIYLSRYPDIRGGRIYGTRDYLHARLYTTLHNCKFTVSHGYYSGCGCLIPRGTGPAATRVSA